MTSRSTKINIGASEELFTGSHHEFWVIEKIGLKKYGYKFFWLSHRGSGNA